MILILSSSCDVSTDYVIDWLVHYKHGYIRVNADELIEGECHLSLSNKCFCYKNRVIHLDEINAIWFRKFGKFFQTSYYQSIKNNISSQDILQLIREYNSVLASICSLLRNKKWITPYWLSNVNKIDMLFRAEQHGLDIPKTWIISLKSDLTSLLDQGFQLISKSIFDPYFIEVKDGFYSMFTKSITNTNDFPETFFPSLIQEKIPKEYELRIFYLNGDFFTMAIFSQSGKSSEEDFRNYDQSSPLKRIPYNLPDIIKINLHKMLLDLGLNCCSIDMIKSSKNGLYYFLEVNPTGQFGMTSVPCNYELFKLVAQTLIKMD